MKIFIAGARSIKQLNPVITNKLYSIYSKNFDVCIGDCYGVDTIVQNFYNTLGYRNVSVYASNGIARNNIGNWTVKFVPVTDDLKGFDFYRQKDKAMAADADFGFMIWDGKSKGTLNNIITLISLGKHVLVYLYGNFYLMRSMDTLNSLIKLCPKSTADMFNRICADNSTESINPQQISMTI